VRYVLTIDNMCAPDCVVWVREQLTGLGYAYRYVVGTRHAREASEVQGKQQGKQVYRGQR